MRQMPRRCCRLWLSLRLSQWVSLLESPSLHLSQRQWWHCCLRLRPRERLRPARLGLWGWLSWNWQVMSLRPGRRWKCLDCWKGTQRLWVGQLMVRMVRCLPQGGRPRRRMALEKWTVKERVLLRR
jgi:hypothetical protein